MKVLEALDAFNLVVVPRVGTEEMIRRAGAQGLPAAIAGSPFIRHE